MPRFGQLVLGAVVSLGVAPAAHALPAFARRFNLACGACHIAVPRLNAFGEEFHMNGFKPPGTMWAPLPGSAPEGVKQLMAVWTRGEYFEHSDFARGPTPRGSFGDPEHASIYVAGALTSSTSVFMELENTVHETDINKRGDFVSSDTGGIQKGFLMIDLPMLLGLHGVHNMAGMEHAGHAGMQHDMGDMDGGMAAMGEGLVGPRPVMRVRPGDPSTKLSL